MTPTREELALLGLASNDDLPSGGQVLKVTVCCGSGTARAWTNMLGPVLALRYGVNIEPGSLNLWADSDIVWREPMMAFAGDREWELCPIVLDEQAIGVAFRGNSETPRLLEVMAPIRLRTRLGDAKDGDRVLVRLLPGSALGAAV